MRKTIHVTRRHLPAGVHCAALQQGDAVTLVLADQQPDDGTMLEAVERTLTEVVAAW